MALRELLGTNVVALVIGLLAAIWIGIQEVRNELVFLWKKIKDIAAENQHQAAETEQPTEQSEAESTVETQVSSDA